MVMRKTLPLIFAALFIMPAGALAQTVEGTVLDAATGAGVAGVKCELVKDGPVLYDMVTGPSGRFHFENVKEGEGG